MSEETKKDEVRTADILIEDSEAEVHHYVGIGIGLGTAFGVTFGVVFGEAIFGNVGAGIGAGIAIGIGVGVAIGSALSRASRYPGPYLSKATPSTTPRSPISPHPQLDHYNTVVRVLCDIPV